MRKFSILVLLIIVSAIPLVSSAQTPASDDGLEHDYGGITVTLEHDDTFLSRLWLGHSVPFTENKVLGGFLIQNGEMNADNTLGYFYLESLETIERYDPATAQEFHNYLISSEMLAGEDGFGFGEPSSFENENEYDAISAPVADFLGYPYVYSDDPNQLYVFIVDEYVLYGIVSVESGDFSEIDAILNTLTIEIEDTAGLSQPVAVTIEGENPAELSLNIPLGWYSLIDTEVGGPVGNTPDSVLMMSLNNPEDTIMLIVPFWKENESLNASDVVTYDDDPLTTESFATDNFISAEKRTYEGLRGPGILTQFVLINEYGTIIIDAEGNMELVEDIVRTVQLQSANELDDEDLDTDTSNTE